MDQHLPLEIRWMIKSDLPKILVIERQSFDFPWTQGDFLCCLHQRNCIGMVAECNHRIVGFMVYELHKAKLHILNFAVATEFRRQNVGSQMVEKLVDKLSQQRRNEIILEVRESNLVAQLFFKKQTFKTVLVLRNHFDDTGEDAYGVRYSLNDELPWHEIADGKAEVVELETGVAAQ